MGAKSTGNILCRCYGEGELEKAHGNVLFTKMQQVVELASTSGWRECRGTAGTAQIVRCQMHSVDLCFRLGCVIYMPQPLNFPFIYNMDENDPTDST